MLLESWTALKPKLQPLIYLSQHKILIKEALEIYLNQSSNFLSEWVSPIPHPGASEEVKRSYQQQKEKNEKIVRECKELLSKLEEN